jgi:hypothetical protein
MLFSLALPALAAAQATRTWVSGVGDDANPCSRTAPCKTWAGAIAKTAAGGEIDALDPGGFGALTITKSITLDGGGGQVASVLVAGTNGITVAAGATDRVIIRNLRFDGLAGNGSSLGTAGIDGISFLSGASLRLENVNIFGFAQQGVSDTATGPSSLVISDSTIADNFGDGVLIDPSSGKGTAVLEGTSLEDNACGLVVSTVGGGSGPCGTGTTGTGFTASVTAMGSSMSVNTTDGILSTGAGSNVFATSDLVTANGRGLDAENGGQLVSLCGNAVGGNSSDGAPTSTLSTGCASTGPPGATGATGPQGPRGAAGDIELVTCRKVKVHKHTKTKCTGKLVSGVVKFTVSGHAVHATLDRAGATVASGTVTVGGASDVGLLSVTRKLRPGHYLLKLWRHGRVTARQNVQLG